ncbi:uncharacterized protein LOC135438094 isoform X2 [Drosophila montana]|uniref:uncharacterized protein LOC135438094 isoform X2 n=1 Tax=Drosophila montana TaxID=40370 RepID=UPI00313D32D5
MVSALNGFGMAIGCMDITGAVFFELMIIYMLCRRNGGRTTADDSKEKQQQQGHVATFYGNRVRPWMLWIYLLLLNVWIVVSMLMRLPQHKPQLLLFWLVWCFGGLIFDVVFVGLWIVELLSGDAIEALTNILISLLTMAIEFSFIYVIYNIYGNLTKSPKEQDINGNSLLRFSHFLF